MKKIITRASRIHNKGIFATRDIRRGELIDYVRGSLRHLHIRSRKEAAIGPDWIGVSARAWINPKWPFSYINHSCNPSAGIEGKIRCRAMRDIRKGEEVTIDYSTTEASPFWEMRCRCRQPNCRKVVRAIQFLPYSRFKKYLPFVPTYFQKVYYAHHHG